MFPDAARSDLSCKIQKKLEYILYLLSIHPFRFQLTIPATGRLHTKTFYYSFLRFGQSGESCFFTTSLTRFLKNSEVENVPISPFLFLRTETVWSVLSLSPTINM